MSVSSRQCEAPLIPRLAIIDDAEFDQMLYARLIKRAGIVGETISFRLSYGGILRVMTSAYVEKVILE